MMTILSAKADDKAFFSGVHLGMTIDEARSYYHKLSNVGELWHSGAPPGQGQSDFRASTFPQRRVYVYYRKADGRIVSVLYWKLVTVKAFHDPVSGDLLPVLLLDPPCFGPKQLPQVLLVFGSDDDMF